MKRFDSVIFDIDGTLWDATETLAEAYSAASVELAAHFGKEVLMPRVFTGPQVKAELGQPTIEIFHHLYPELGERAEEAGLDADAVYAHVVEYSVQREYDYLREQGARLYPELKETLTVLKEKYPLLIVSNCEKGYIELFTGFSGTESLFAGHVSYGDTEMEKDRNIRLIMERHGLQAPVYVGDIEKDAISARRAGVGFIWASYGFGQVPPHLYDAKIGALAELTALL